MLAAFTYFIIWFSGHAMHCNWTCWSWYECRGHSIQFDTTSNFVTEGQSTRYKNNVVDRIFTTHYLKEFQAML